MARCDRDLGYRVESCVQSVLRDDTKKESEKGTPSTQSAGLMGHIGTFMSDIEISDIISARRLARRLWALRVIVVDSQLDWKPELNYATFIAKIYTILVPVVRYDMGPPVPPTRTWRTAITTTKSKAWASIACNIH